MSQSGISQLEQDTFLQILNWVEEVVEGKGASLAQMMVSTVLGLIPFVGQAVDAYNILRGLYHLTRTPDSNEHWLDLVLSLIALAPGFGDALKNVCHRMGGFRSRWPGGRWMCESQPCQPDMASGWCCGCWTSARADWTCSI